MRSNTRRVNPKVVTHEGGQATANLSPILQLRRSVLSTLLFEGTFYESGQDIAERIKSLCMSEAIHIGEIASLAAEARNRFHLRHAPLWLLCGLIARGSGDGIVARTIEQTIQRPDEMAELVSMWNGGDRRTSKTPLPAQMKKGLARAFQKFDAYQLAKYDRKYAVKLPDVLRLVHPRPIDEAQAENWGKLRKGELETPNTWETRLSAGENKKETFEDLITSGRLGYMALLRNLRNMEEAGVDPDLIKKALLDRNGASKMFPYRFVSAARHAPRYEAEIGKAMIWAIEHQPKLLGRTVIVVDCSASMDAPVSSNSEINRKVAAATLASMINGDDVRLFVFGSTYSEIAFRRGIPGVDHIAKHRLGGTNLGAAIKFAESVCKDYDRIIVITDEQTADRVDNPENKGYMINVAPYKDGVGYGKWTHIDGFSSHALRYIYEVEREGLA